MLRILALGASLALGLACAPHPAEASTHAAATGGHRVSGHRVSGHRVSGHRVSGTVVGVGEVAETAATLFTASGHEVRYAYNLDGDGSFSFSGVPDGTYKLYASQNDGGDPDASLTGTYYGGSIELDQGTAIVVHGSDVALGSIDLPAQAVLSGVVRDRSGAPAARVPIQVRRLDPHLDAGFYSRAVTSASGRFTLPLPPSRYKIRIGDASDSAYAAHWYPRSPTQRSGRVVRMSHDLDLGALQVSAGGSLAGRVTGAGRPLYRLDVEAVNADGTVLGSTRTTKAGAYLLQHLYPGSYRVRLHDEFAGFRTQLYDGRDSLAHATPVRVREQTTTSLRTVRLRPRPPLAHPGTDIEGTVTDERGRPAVGVVVFARVASSSPNHVQEVDSTSTDRSGHYYLQHLDPASTGTRARAFKLEFEDFGPDLDCVDGGSVCQRAKPSRDFLLVSRYSGDQPTFQQADPVVIGAGRPAVSDIVLHEYGGISGRATVRRGALSRGPFVEAYDTARRWVGDGRVLADGSYHFDDLPAGVYRLKFSGLRAGAPAVTRWYRNGRGFASATPVTVRSGLDRPGISVALPAG